MGISVVDDSNLSQNETITIEYLPVKDVWDLRWRENIKLGDVGGIVRSIMANGFKDPPQFDSKLGAIVVGNHRTKALYMMERQGYDMPRGIRRHTETGVWCMPVIFGLDADSVSAAKRYAIDHNNLSMSGGNFDHFDMSRLWDDNYISLLDSFYADGEEMPITVTHDGFESLIQARERDEQSQLGADEGSVDALFDDDGVSANGATDNTGTEGGSGESAGAVDTPSKSDWHQLSIELPPHIYSMYVELTEGHGATDSERFEFLIRSLKLILENENII